ncbi:hypothetical protein Hanom_Chr15g01347881 [Helianthus anomalus]
MLNCNVKSGYIGNFTNLFKISLTNKTKKEFKKYKKNKLYPLSLITLILSLNFLSL